MTPTPPSLAEALREAHVCEMPSECVDAEAEVARLKAALEKYGQHEPECRRAGWYRGRRPVAFDGVPCTCGLDAALATEGGGT